MKPNPGGQLPLNEIVGRDALIEEIWEVLDVQSIYINDDRRVGKTQILNKLKGEPKLGWYVVKRDVSSCHSAGEFAACVLRDAHSEVPTTKRFSFRRLREYLGDVELGAYGFKVKLANGKEAPWKDVLINTIQDLDEALSNLGNRIVFLWDELPFHISNVSKRESPQTAMEVLDVLRVLSQSCRQIRFVYTGSIGLHHVLADLRSKGYSNAPINHMRRMVPGPIAQADAQKLAHELILGVGLKCPKLHESSLALAQAVGCIPFYIHKLIAYWPKARPLELISIDEVLTKEITKSDSDWELDHYRNRIPEYYGQNEDLVLTILNVLAKADRPLKVDEIINQANAQASFNDKKRLRNVLGLMEDDHYIKQDEVSGGHEFRFPLVKRWWRIKQCF